MKRLAWGFLVGIVASVMLFGCKGADGPQGPAGTALTGTLYGKVQAYDSFGNYLGYMSGVTVNAEGTSYSATTDSLGVFGIGGLPTGTYTLTFAKAGYGTNKITQVQFVGGGDYFMPNNAYIGGLPNFEAATATAAIGAGNLNVTGTVTGGSPPYNRRVIMYIAKTSTINPSVPSTFVRYYGYYIASSANNYSFSISVSSLMSNYGFATGNTIYVAVYSAGYYDWSYWDYPTGKDVETAYGTVAKPSSVVIP